MTDPPVEVTPRERRVSRNLDRGEVEEKMLVTPRERRVSRNLTNLDEMSNTAMSRLARGV